MKQEAPVIDPCCGNCFFYDLNLQGSRGLCKRHAPVLVKIGHAHVSEGWIMENRFPRVMQKDYCGDHKALQPVEAPPKGSAALNS